MDGEVSEFVVVRRNLLHSLAEVSFLTPPSACRKCSGLGYFLRLLFLLPLFCNSAHILQYGKSYIASCQRCHKLTRIRRGELSNMAGSQIVLTWGMAPLVAGFLSLAHCTAGQLIFRSSEVDCLLCGKMWYVSTLGFPICRQTSFFKPLHKDR